MSIVYCSAPNKQYFNNIHDAVPLDNWSNISVPALPYITIKIENLSSQYSLYKMPHVDAQPITDNKNVVCQDPWVSFLITQITIIGIIFYICVNVENVHFAKATVMKELVKFTSSLAI